jgi:probable phosphoglycerate mutase
MRAVAWSLLTGVTTPGREEMRNFHSFADRYLIPNGGVAELRYTGPDTPRLLGASTMHLPADLAQHAH